jgi:hypothetical protein
VYASDIDQPRTHHRVVGHEGNSGVGGRCLPAGDAVERATRLFFAKRELELALGQAAAVVKEAGTVDEADDTQPRRFARGESLYLRDELRADASDAEDDDVRGVGLVGDATAAHLVEAERRMDCPHRVTRLTVVDDERDVALSRALRDRDDVHRRVGDSAEDARRDARHVGHAGADDGDRRQA